MDTQHEDAFAKLHTKGLKKLVFPTKPGSQSVEDDEFLKVELPKMLKV